MLKHFSKPFRNAWRQSILTVYRSERERKMYHTKINQQTQTGKYLRDGAEAQRSKDRGKKEERWETVAYLAVARSECEVPKSAVLPVEAAFLHCRVMTLPQTTSVPNEMQPRSRLAQILTTMHTTFIQLPFTVHTLWQTCFNVLTCNARLLLKHWSNFTFAFPGSAAKIFFRK